MGFSTSQMKYLNLLSSGNDQHRLAIKLIGEMSEKIVELRKELLLAKRRIREMEKDSEKGV